jgi:hypothetical protein
MAIPEPNHPCWQRLASGSLSKIRTEHLGTQLMTKRLERSPAPAIEKAAEIYAFFAKWERVLGAEVQQITRL